MSLDKFVPLSPDPDLNTGADMTLARFGHLNKLVDEINSGGGGGGGGLIDAGEGTCSSIRINVDNQAFGEYGSTLGGSLVKTCNDYTASYFGRQSCAIGCYSSVNGTSNVVVARNSHILSGNNNTIAYDATQGAWDNFTASSYSGNYFGFCVTGASPQIVTGSIYRNNCDLTAVWPPGSTFSFKYTYACGVPATGSCYSQIQGIDIPVICSVYNGSGYTCLLFCYDPALPNFQGVVCGSYSYGYLQKTGSFSSYSTTCSSYHPNVIVGGEFNTIRGFTSAATISGGYHNTISNGYTTITGGCYNIADNGGDMIGGRNNRSCFAYNSLITGTFNIMCNSYSSFITGTNNCMCGSSDSIITGNTNYTFNNPNGSIIGGSTNKICNAQNSGIYSSLQSCIDSGLNSSIIATNNSCIMAGSNNTIISGTANINCSGGRSSIINSTCSIIPSGFCGATIIGGNQITADRNDTVFVYNLSIVALPQSASGLPSKSLWYDSATCVVKFVP